jgi:hypothetical protein
MIHRQLIKIPLLVIHIAFAFACGGTVDMSGDSNDDSPSAVCPSDMVASTMKGVELTGGVQPAGSEVSFAWELVRSPEGSSAEPPQPTDQQISTFVPDVVGAYTLRLTVSDGSGATSWCDVDVTAISEDGLHVELSWNPPESMEDRSNANLHLLQEDAPYWFHYLLDCHSSNCTLFEPALDWDGAGPDDDPRLDPIDSEGFGPEIINIQMPVTGSIYTVGIHYFQGNGMDEGEVLVRIFCGRGSSEPAFEAGPVTMRDYGGDTDGNDFWKVAEVTWNGDSCSVRPIDEMVLALAARRER